MAMTIGGERWTQTLSSILVTPANRLALFLGRALPNLANGIIVSTVGFVVGWLLLDFSLIARGDPGDRAHRRRDLVLLHGVRDDDRRLRPARPRHLLLREPVIFVFLLFCGVNVPVDSLPGWMQADRPGPAADARDRRRRGRSPSGASLGDVSGLVWTEAGSAPVYAALAYGLLRYFEFDGRRRATLETM